MHGAMPRCIGPHLQFAGVQAVGNGQYQHGCQRNPNSQGVECTLRIRLTGVFEQKSQPAEETDNDADEQNNNESFYHVVRMLRGNQNFIPSPRWG